MDIRELKYFLAVANEQNLTKAAEQLYITQPSLTRQMQNLEREIGCSLFIRTGKKMILTEAGLLLKKRAEEIVSLVNKTTAEMMYPNSDASGDIYIGSGETYAFKFVADAIEQIQKRYPNIRFHIFSGNTDDVIEKLDNGLIDFGVLVEPFAHNKYDFLRLPFSEEWGVLMRKDSPLSNKKFLTFDDLNGLPLITSSHILKDKNHVINKLVQNPNIVATYNLIYNASILVRSGVGYALGFKDLINTDNSDLCAIAIEPSILSFIDIAWKKNQVFSHPAKIFLQVIQDILTNYSNQN